MLKKRQTLLPLLFALSSLLFSLGCASETESDDFLRDLYSARVIYGQDNRVDVVDYPESQFRNYAQSVAGMVPSFRLHLDRNGQYRFPLITLAQGTRVCSDEQFADQYVLPRCSSFLIAPDLLLTAGHCFVSEDDCQRSQFVFEYLDGMRTLEKDQVYSCAEVVQSELSESRTRLRDYAIVRLDRPVEGREPLEIRTSGRARIGTPLVVIGHPSGLPQKISDGAKIRRMNSKEIRRPFSTLLKKRDYFNADLDTFRGNSGSPVFNHRTGLVEGIIVQGEEDYFFDREDNCMRPNVLRNSRWDADENILRITRIENLESLIQESYQRSLKYNGTYEEDFLLAEAN